MIIQLCFSKGLFLSRPAAASLIFGLLLTGTTAISLGADAPVPPKLASADVTIGDDGLVPHALDIDQSGQIYVGGGREVWVYNAQGKRMSTWQFDQAGPVRVASDGTIVIGKVWDTAGHLKAFDKTGLLLRLIGMGKWLHGDAVGFDVPMDFAFDSNDNIWSIDTHNIDDAENRKVPNMSFGATARDSNGGRIMFFDLKSDPQGKHPAYFGTWSPTPPEAGGPPDALHLPSRIAFDPLNKKIFVLDAWGVTRWSWPDGKFEARIIREKLDRNSSLMAVTSHGTLFLRLGGSLGEYDNEGKKLRDLRNIDVEDAMDLRVTGDGSLYLCYPHRGFAFKKYSPAGELVLCRGLNVVHVNLSLEDTVYTAGQKVAIDAAITDRQKLYNQTFPGLDEVKPTLWMRPYDHSSAWRRLAMETGADGKTYFTIPLDLQGACLLRLSASPAAAEFLDSTAASATLSLAVKSPEAKNGNITVSTDRNQKLFVSGQWLRANVIGRSIAGVNNEVVQVRLVDAQGKSVIEKNAAWTIPEKGSFNLPFDMELGSGVAAGSYNITVTSPSLGTSTTAIRVGEARENGRFALFTPLGFGQATSYQTVQGMADVAAEQGFTHDVTRYIQFPQAFGLTQKDFDINRTMRKALSTDPLLPAPESAELPSRMRLALNELAFHGTHLWPETMGWEQDTLNRTDAQKITDTEALAQWTQWGLNSPAQDGYLWNETNWWDLDVNRFKEQWSKATGQPVSTLDGFPPGDRNKESDPLISGDRLTTLLGYVTYAAKHLYPDSYISWRDYVRQMRPDTMSAGVPYIYWHNWPEWSSNGLDGIMSYHQVEQIAEPYMQLNDGAMMLHDGKPFWAGVEIEAESNTGEYTARTLLPSLLWGSEGFWANDMAAWQAPIFGNQMVLQACHDLKAVLDPVGHRLRDTRYRPALGIYYPMTAHIQGGHVAFDGTMYAKRVKSVLIASFHAHIPAKIVFDEDLKANRFDGLKYLLMPGLQSEITPDDLASLNRFKKQGGTILLGDGTDNRYASLGTPLNVDFEIEKDDGYIQFWGGDDVIEKRLHVLALAEKLKTTLAPYLTPTVQIDDPEIWYSLREGKDNAEKPVTYLVAVNQNYPDTLKPFQLWKMTNDYVSIIPVVRPAVVPSQFKYGYDLLRGKAFEITDGKIELNFQRFAANVIALSSQPLTAADLREAAPVKTTPISLSLKQAPDTDVFMARDIHQALTSDGKIFILGDNDAVRIKVAGQMTQEGIEAQPSVQPGDGVNIVVAYPGDHSGLDQKDVLPLRLTENVPGLGRALLTYARCYLPKATDAILLAVGDDGGLAKGIKALLELKNQAQPAEDRLVAPQIQPAAPASLQDDTTKIWGARLAAIDAAGGTVAVGAAEWGNNLFLLDTRDGKLRAASKAGRFYNQKLWMSQSGDKIGAEALFPEDVNGYLEMFDSSGKSLARFARDGIDAHNNWSFYRHTMRQDIFSFALSPDGAVVYSGSNLGLSALKSDGTLLWRHDYAGMDTSLDFLRNMWASCIDLTHDGKYLAEGLTHELSNASVYRGTSIIRKVDAATGKILWEKTLDPAQSPKLTEIAIAPDGTTIAAVGHGHLLFLRDGQIIRQRPMGSTLHYSSLTWNADSKLLYAIVDNRSQQQYPGIGQSASANQNAVMAFSEDGIPQWQFNQAVPVIDLVTSPQGGVILSDGLRAIKRLTSQGELQWTASTEATAHICASGDSVYAGDWHGNVYKLALSDGTIAWKTNVTDSVWRDDIKQLLVQPYAGPTYGAPQRAAAEPPLEGTNVASQATVKVQGEQGWFKSDKVNIDPSTLVDGAVDNLTNPWLSTVDQEKADNWGKFVSVEFQWPNPVNIQGLAIHEDSRHPESFPYNCALQVFEDGDWHDLAVRVMGPPGPWHNIVLSQPREVTRIRYWPTSIQSNNLWTDEIKVIAVPSK